MDINIKSCQITTPPLPLFYESLKFSNQNSHINGHNSIKVYGTISKEASPRTDYCMFSFLALTGIQTTLIAIWKTIILFL